MEEKLKLLAVKLYQSMAISNNCYVFPKNTEFTEINWLVVDESLNGCKVTEKFQHLSEKDLVFKKLSTVLLGNKIADKEFSSFICEIYSLYQILGRGWLISSCSVWEQITGNNQKHCFAGVSPQFFDDVLKKMIDSNFWNIQSAEFVNKPVKDEGYFHRRLIAEVDRVIVNPSDLLSVVYAAYAIYLHNVDYGKYPEIFLLPAKTELIYTARCFINSQGLTAIAVCSDAPEYIASLKGKSLMVIPQYKMADYYCYYNENLKFYVINEDFDKLCSSEFITENTLINWLDKYVKLHEEILQTGQDVSSSFTHFGNLTPEFIEEWKNTDKELENNENELEFDYEAVGEYYLQNSNRLQKHFSKVTWTL